VGAGFSVGMGSWRGLNLSAYCTVCGVQSIFSTLFCRWQQRCGLSLSVVQQLVIRQSYVGNCVCQITDVVGATRRTKAR